MNWFLSRKKDHNALINGDKTITVKAGQNLLAAGLEAGLPWDHDCRVGSCGTCQCYLKKGKIKRLSDFSYVLDGDQLNEGMILACQSELRNDVEIEVKLDENAVPREFIKCTGELTELNKLTHDIVEMIISCDKSLPKTALAGQYAELKHKDFDKPRSYSFACPPGNEKNNKIHFFIRYVPNGKFTEWLFSEESKIGTEFEVNAPYGNFWLRESDAPMICLAGGSGMSAVKAILEDAVNKQVARNAYFLFGARKQHDLYCREAMEKITANWNPSYSFKYLEVLSEETENSGWHGDRGYVTKCLQNKYIDTGEIVPQKCQGYLCGPPPMIDSAIKMLVEAGMSEKEIFYDKFLDSSTIPGGR